MSTIISIADTAVDAALDAELRSLLSTCFTGPEDHVFARQRYWREPPRWRWLLRDSAGQLAAHVAVHDKTLGHPTGTVRVAGIAEVAVHPLQRGKGLMRTLLARVHQDCAGYGLGWAALFGNPKVYASSGYGVPGNPVRYLSLDRTQWIDGPPDGHFQVLRLRSDAPAWPTGNIDLRGWKF